MSVLFLKRFLSRPRQVASIIPSSRALVRKVMSKMDFSKPRTIVEFGPGEGCHTREMLKRMNPESHLLCFELDPELAGHLRDEFKAEPRVSVLNADAATLPQALADRNLPLCDYVVSGIPFSLIEPEKKRLLLQSTYDSLAPHDDAAFVIYQVTNELRDRGHCDHFPRAETEYCLANIPPMFVTKFYKTANGHGKTNGSGH
jgi:phosphatidylethanolamine/phosphatidyl-N-methylethanolamine N-methyltransferase